MNRSRVRRTTPPERCTVRQMIRSFTIDGARALFLGRQTGSLTVGKSADLIVLDTNILKVPPEQISSAKVLLTIFRGKQIFKAESR